MYLSKLEFIGVEVGMLSSLLIILPYKEVRVLDIYNTYVLI